MPITASAKASTCTSCAPSMSRKTALAAITSEATTRIAASARAPRFSAFPCPYGMADVGRPAGDPDREEGQEGRNEIGSRVRRLREKAEAAEWIPATSLSAMRTSAAKTETSAVRRWGDMRGA